ncbi:hypothetical protein HD806DRAFT_536523 [Xylariaceae sp. AK1471]|nr:hypothetical protein HD806DRAFT_536523 [Xylariaceae sp. AK1471]
MLSSFCGVFGNRGQANYVAGCGFQDALAHAHCARGKHAVSVDLSLMRDVGWPAKEGAVSDNAEWEKTGAQLFTGLGTRAGSVEAGIKSPYYLDTDAHFGIVARDGAEAAGEGGGEEPLAALIPRAENLSEAAQAVISAFMVRVAKMLAMPPGELDAGRFLHSYGIDSLATIEIVNWALQDCQARIAVCDVMAAVSMTIFSERVAAKSGLLAKEV